MTNNSCIFDIETIKNPNWRLFMPKFDLPEEFNPDFVKLGNATKAETIQKKLMEAELNWPATWQAKKNAHEQEFAEKCAVSAITGMIACINFSECSIDRKKEWILVVDERKSRHDNVVNVSDERSLLQMFWEEWNRHDQMISFGGRGFDLPFIIQRSWINNVKVPIVSYEDDPRHLDLQRIWRGTGWTSSDGVKNSLDNVCTILGLGTKIKGIDGEDIGPNFEKYFINHFELAMDYCLGDAVLTRKLKEVIAP